MKNSNIISVSWGDHLSFGEGDGRLSSPEAVKKRMRQWRDVLGASVVHWRLIRTHIKGHFYSARGTRHFFLKNIQHILWDDLEIVPPIAHEEGLKVYLYVSLFDEGWPLFSKKTRAHSYHNAMHGRSFSWQSSFSKEHPEYAVTDRTGKNRQWGVLCIAYPEVRSHFYEQFLKFLDGREFDGLFVCLRSQSRPAEFADQYSFNDPIKKEYLARYGKDISMEDFDLQAWRDLQGEYLTHFFAELYTLIKPRGIRLAAGAPRGDIMGPPFGNAALDWREWIKRGIIDDFIINQNSCRCPSMWIDLWPMHRGYGYTQNYLDKNFWPLLEHLEQTYKPVFEDSSVNLYLARQWDERSESEENALLSLPYVKGLVFSSFRFDNPSPIARGDWRA